MTASRSCKSQAVSRAASLVIVELQHFERYATRAGPTSAFGSSEGVGRVTSAVALSCLSVNRQRTQRFNHRSVSVIFAQELPGLLHLFLPTPYRADLCMQLQWRWQRWARP
jgi:hypothetical protein